MSQELDAAVRAALHQHQPARVLPFRGEEELRPIVVPNVKQKYVRTLANLRDVPWTKLLFLDKAGGTLHTLCTEDHDEGDGDAPELAAGNAHDLHEARILGLLIKAQQAVMTYKSNEATEALNACIRVMQVITDQVVGAVSTMAQLHAAQLKAAQATAALAEAAAGPESSKLLETLAPIFAQKLLAPAPTPPAPAKPTNGA